MSDATSTYSLQWDGNFTPGALEAAGAGKKLASALRAITKAATGANTSVAKAGGAASTAIARAGAGAKAAAKGVGASTLNLRAMARALRSTGGEAGAFLGRGASIVSVLGRLAASPVGVAVAIGVLALALVAGAAAFVGFAISSADAARSQRLLAEAATGSAHGAEMLDANVRAVTASTGLSIEAATKLGSKLSQAGLAGRDLANAMHAAGIASSTLGDEAGNKIASIAENAKKGGAVSFSDASLKGTGVGLNDVGAALAARTGVSLQAAKAALQAGKVDVSTALDALDAAVDKKLGKIAKLQALSLPNQLARLKTNVRGLFSGSDIEKFLEGTKDVLSVFDQSTVAGRALKATITGLAQPLVDAATAAGPYVKQFFTGFTIAALQVAIVVLRIKKAIQEAFSGVGDIGGMNAALIAGKVVLFGLAAVLLIVAAGFAVVAVAVAAVLAPVYAAYSAISTLVDAFSAGVDSIRAIDLGQVGSDAVTGLVNGITRGVSSVVNAASDLGASARDALKHALGIHSPSVVFARLGEQTAAGFQEGVEAGADGANRSVSTMVDVPRARSAGGGGGGDRIIHVDNMVFHGIKDAEDLKSPAVRDQFLAMLEEAVFGSGGPMPTPEGT